MTCSTESLGAALVLTLVPSIQGQEEPSLLPPEAAAMCERLDELSEVSRSVRCVMLDAKRDLLLASDAARGAEVQQSVDAWLANLTEEGFPSYDQALAALERWSALPRSDPDRESQVRLLVDYRRTLERELCTMRFDSGMYSSSLITRDLAFVYYSSVGRILINPRDGSSGSTHVRLGSVFYPLPMEPEYLAQLRALRWTAGSLGEGKSWARARVEGAASDELAARFRSGQPIPEAIVGFTRTGPKDEDIAYTLTFFRHVPTVQGQDPGIGVYEALQFDTLGIKGVLAMRRVILFDVELGASAESEAARMPIQFSSPRLGLQDRRVPTAPRNYGVDVTTWPQELLEYFAATDR